MMPRWPFSAWAGHRGPPPDADADARYAQDYPHLFDPELFEEDEGEYDGPDDAQGWWHEPEPDGPSRTSGSVRTCVMRGSGLTSWDVVGEEARVCNVCKTKNNFDASQPYKEETPAGTWVYMPNGPPGDYGDGSTASRPHRRRVRRSRKHRHARPNGDPHDDHPEEGQAESERLTVDPVVDVTPRPSHAGDLYLHDKEIDLVVDDVRADKAHVSLRPCLRG